MSWPSSRTRPVTRAPGTSSCMRLRERSSVDLPQPEGPIRAVTVFSRKARSTSRTPELAPYQAVSVSAASRGATAAAPSGGAAALRGPGAVTGGARRWRSGVLTLGTHHRPRDEAEGQDEHDQDQSAGPRLAVPLVVGTQRVDVDLQRQGGHRPLEPGGEELVAERGEQERRRLARHAGDRH